MKANLSSEISLNHVSRSLYCPDDVIEQSRLTRMEQLPVTIYETPRAGAKNIAAYIAGQIRQRQQEQRRYVLSLSPGRSTGDIFAELVRMHREEGLSFYNVEVFDLFEYYPLTDKKSGNHAQVRARLLSHIDIPA